MRSTLFLTALLTLFAPALFAAAPSDEIVGTWRGSSICNPDAHRAACKDETVVYDFTPTAKSDVVHQKAYKIVNGEKLLMGEIDFHRDARGKWVGHFENPNVKLEIVYTIDGKRMKGVLYVLPERIVGRNMDVTRE